MLTGIGLLLFIISETASSSPCVHIFFFYCTSKYVPIVNPAVVWSYSLFLHSLWFKATKVGHCIFLSSRYSGSSEVHETLSLHAINMSVVVPEAHNSYACIYYVCFVLFSSFKALNKRHCFWQNNNTRSEARKTNHYKKKQTLLNQQYM